MILYEIETVSGLFNDLNEAGKSYSTAAVSKPYKAINDEYYIQLKIQELNMCKHINYEYFYEKLLLFKHKSKHSCESVLLFDLDKHIIESSCKFYYEYNTTEIPSILMGGPNYTCWYNQPKETGMFQKL